MKKYLLLLTLSQIIHAHQIALTFDDLPSQHNNKINQLVSMTQNIIDTLNEFNAPATGFVNELKLQAHDNFDANVAVLKMWVDNGYPLANHTYSHPMFSKTTLSDFKDEVIKGSIVSKQLMQGTGLAYRYFRYPGLDTEKDIEKRIDFESFLQDQGLRVAPVTINTDDWVFNKYLLLHPQDAQIIIQQYFEHVQNIILFSQYVSQQLFGRNIKHILLVHVNFLTATTIRQLLQIIKSLDYDIVSLDEVMQDEAYQQPNTYGQDGILLYKWARINNVAIDWSKFPNPKNYFTHYTTT